MLCSECHSIFKTPLQFVQSLRRWDQWEAQFEYATTLFGLEQKADYCYGCRGILRKLRETKGPNVPEILENTSIQVKHWLIVPTDQENGKIMSFGWVVCKEFEFTKRELIYERVGTEDDVNVYSSNTSSVETLDRVKGWLDHCRTHHKACTAAAPSEYWCPTRLIEVQENTLRLVESVEAGVSEPYASLSHCWGGAEILKLEVKTLPLFKQDIPVAKLPKTFQDAVTVLRGLDLRYIWIDSLCIIQDSDEDWQREALTMIKVYQHALCNIAATNSKNSHRGFFKERNPSLVTQNFVDVENGPLKGRFRFGDKTFFTQEIDNAALNRRCWVVQERILSGRIIHFASDQVIWDCSELSASESMPLGTKIWSTTDVHSKVGSRNQQSQFLRLPKSLDGALTQWARIVNTYSDCGLAFIGDKLIAMSGMAEYMRNQSKLQYCAGLWHPHKLEIQLAWHIDELKSQDNYRNNLAPSWSWASVNNPVSMQQIDLYEGYDIIPLATITEASTQEEWTDRAMKTTGSLLVRCSLNPVELKGNSENAYLEGKNMEYAVRVWIDSPDVIGAERLFVIPLFDLQSPMSLEDKWNVYSEIRGLLLQGELGNPGTYQRCGHVFLSGRVSEETKAFEPGYQALKSPVGKEDLPCIEFDSSTGHLIKLV